jgi:methyl-accepting chemotaxis protein
MTKQNAGNATQADSLMKQANQVVQKANGSMESLTSSMREITIASEETSKIIKTIDEIAFQTNLLALNAAVEAARAGEAGAGFAVVAEEVRNLAMRAADAAKNTSGLIEGTVKKIKDGSNLVMKTNEAFAEVAVSASKVGELVGEIAAASQEQAHGIDQISRAVVEMDKVTQQTAANAEESASASEEMNAQAEHMKNISFTLVNIIGGSLNDTGNITRTDIKAKKGIRGVFAAVTSGKEKTKDVMAPRKVREVNPDKVIPMREGQFKDF